MIDVVEVVLVEDAFELAPLADVTAVVLFSLRPWEIGDPDIVAARFEFVDERRSDASETTSYQNFHYYQDGRYRGMIIFCFVELLPGDERTVEVFVPVDTDFERELRLDSAAGVDSALPTLIGCCQRIRETIRECVGIFRWDEPSILGTRYLLRNAPNSSCDDRTLHRHRFEDDDRTRLGDRW
jgi:hypothetical protein